MEAYTETMMDQEIREAFQGINRKLDKLPCQERGIQLATIEEKHKAEEKQKSTRMEFWKIWISIAALILVVIQVVDKFVMR